MDFSDELSIFFDKAKYYLLPWLYCLCALWVFNIINWWTGSKLNIFGIYPRHAFGLLGIVFSPFLHQNFNHLFFNTIPLFALGLVLLARGLGVFVEVTCIVVLLGGLGVFIFGSRGIHIGASGVVSGYFGYILATAYFNPSFTAFFLAIVVLYYFGSIFFGIFPQEEKVSWESHLFGFLAGIGANWIIPFVITPVIGHFKES